MMHTMQALEKTSWCFLCPVCMHRINVGKSQSPRWGKQAGAEGEGGKNMHHSAHQTPGSAFLNPRLALACCPSASPPTHPPSACNPRPWVQAVRDSSPHSLPQMFSQSIHFLDPISRFKKKKSLPTNPWRNVRLTFANVSTISGWLARHERLAMSALRLSACVCTCSYIGLNIFMWFVLSPPPLSFPYNAGGKKGSCHSSTT